MSSQYDFIVVGGKLFLRTFLLNFFIDAIISWSIWLRCRNKTCQVSLHTLGSARRSWW